MHSNLNSSIRQTRSVIPGSHFRVLFAVCRSTNWTRNLAATSKTMTNIPKDKYFSIPDDSFAIFTKTVTHLRHLLRWYSNIEIQKDIIQMPM